MTNNTLLRGAVIVMALFYTERIHNHPMFLSREIGDSNYFIFSLALTCISYFASVWSIRIEEQSLFELN